MSDTTPTEEDDNDNGRRKAILTAAVVILLALICVSVVVAQSTVTESDDFEDGNVDGWSGDGGNPEVSTDSVEGSYSMYMDTVPVGDSGTVQWDSGPVLDTSEEFQIEGVARPNNVDNSQQIRIGLIPEPTDPDANAVLIFDRPNSATYLSSNADPDQPPNDTIGNSFDNEWVNFRITSDGNGTIQATVWGVNDTEPSEPQLEDTFEGVSSGFSTGTGDNPSNAYRELWLDSVGLEGTLATGDPSLNIDTPNLIQHDTTRTYDVEELRPRPGGINSSVDVTDNATVTSSNPEVLSVDSENNTLTATDDTSVAEIVTVEATYDNLTTYKEVTVAEPTVENLQILPGIWRFTAIAGDTTAQVILFGTLLGVVATRNASSFAGLSLMEMAMVMGFLGGWVGLGMVLASTFVAVFIGLNLAANIDYSVRR